MNTIPVAALQLPAHDRADFSTAWPSIVARVESAARAGARLIVLPEGTIPAYVLGTEPPDAAEIDAALADLQSTARRCGSVIVCGFARIENDRTYNSAIAIDADGSLAGHADKCFLWHFDRRWFAAGERIAPISTSLGSLGVLVCADGRMPGIASALVDAGARVLVMPTAWVTSGRDARALENVQADLLARVRAWENAVPFVASNKCGVERGCVAYCGKSQIVDARGRVAAIASQHDAETIVANVAFDVTPRARAARGAEPPPRAGANRPIRVAIAALAGGETVRAAARIVEADAAISSTESEGLEAAVSYARVGDDVVRDPMGLTAYRRAGYRLAIWDVGACDAQWIEPLARARALELRIFVVAVDRARGRAFAVDPDGSIVAGTFGDYRIACFALDPQRAEQTAVAPGTDVAAGLERVDALLRTAAGR